MHTINTYCAPHTPPNGLVEAVEAVWEGLSHPQCEEGLLPASQCDSLHNHSICALLIAAHFKQQGEQQEQRTHMHLQIHTQKQTNIHTHTHT